MLSPTVSTTTELTNAPYSPAQVIARGTKKMTRFSLELGPLTPLQTRKIYSYHLSFTKYIPRLCQQQKYILKVWQWHLRVHPPKYILTALHSQNIFCSCDTDITSFRPMPMAWRSLRSAVPLAWVTVRRGQAPWTPRYTSLISVSVHMFHPDPQVHFWF